MPETLVTLRNGEEVPAVLIAATQIAVAALLNDPDGTIPLWELVSMAKNPNHRPFGMTGERLQDLGLLRPSDGKLDKTVQAIVDAMFDIDLTTFALTQRNPVA